MLRKSFKVLFCLLSTSLSLFLVTKTNLPPISLVNQAWAQTDVPYPMAGADPERTSWVATEVRGSLKPTWYKIFEPYILPRTQIIAAEGKLFVATAKGLYALNADTGAELWVFPTELPLADTPTYVNGVLYIGGFDKKMYALNASNGSLKWSFTAEQGFQVSPVVVNNIVYAGNRDSSFYALDATTGALKWKFKTAGPIVYGAALKDGVVYLVSNDAYAYALNATSGSLVWKSQKLPGYGFHSWWPVIYQDYVIISASPYYRSKLGTIKTTNFISIVEKTDIWGDYPFVNGTLVGPTVTTSPPWANGHQVIDLSKPHITPEGTTTAVTQYLENKPYRRSVIVLQRSNGQEYTTDFNQNGKPEYAPFLFFGELGTRFPPLVGPDGLVYINQHYAKGPLPRGGIVGWKIGTPYINLPTGIGAVDEPRAYVGGGKLIYHNLCCDRSSSAFDIYTPTQNWTYYSYNLETLIPDYRVRYWSPDPLVGLPWTKPFISYGGTTTSTQTNLSGEYGLHGDVNPPVPYKDKVYMHRSNAVIAFAATGNGTPLAWSKTKPSTLSIPIPAKSTIRAKLESEVQKMLSAGHLKPGLVVSGNWDNSISRGTDDFMDYWHHPAETLVSLARTLPHVSSTLQSQVRTYLQNEFTAYPPHTYNHTGFKDGKFRDAFTAPPDIIEAIANDGPRTSTSTFTYTDSDGLNKIVWNFNPYAFYGMWHYAKAMDFSPTQAQSLLDTAKSKSLLMKSFTTVPSDYILSHLSFVHNAYIAGYHGYLELENMAGYPETSTIKQQYTRLLSLRATNFSKDSPWWDQGTGTTYQYSRSINSSRNYIYMTPELADYLRLNALSKVQTALTEAKDLYPYWFVSKAETQFAEGVLKNLYDYGALFKAKAWIAQEPYTELAKYIDIPGLETGDLFYIDNLVLALEAQGDSNVVPVPTPTLPPPTIPGDANGNNKLDIFDHLILILNYGKSIFGHHTVGDFNQDGYVDIKDYLDWLGYLSSGITPTATAQSPSPTNKPPTATPPTVVPPTPTAASSSPTPTTASFPSPTLASASTKPYIWLMSDKDTYVSTGGPLAQIGDLVGEWRDQSGNALHAINTTIGLKPTLKDGGPKNFPSVHFLGDPDTLASPWTVSYLQGTAVMAFRLNSQELVDSPNPHVMRLQPDVDAGTQRISWDWIKSQSTFRFNYRGTVPEYVTSDIITAAIQDDGVWHYASQVWSVADNIMYARVDGTEVGRMSGLNTWQEPPFEMVLGAKTRSGASRSNVEILEVRVFSQKLSDTALLQAENEIATRYGL